MNDTFVDKSADYSSVASLPFFFFVFFSGFTIIIERMPIYTEFMSLFSPFTLPFSPLFPTNSMYIKHWFGIW